MPILTGEVDPYLHVDRTIRERLDKLLESFRGGTARQWPRWWAEVATNPTVPGSSLPASAPASTAGTFEASTFRLERLTAQLGTLTLDRAIADPVKNLSRAARLTTSSIIRRKSAPRN